MKKLIALLLCLMLVTVMFAGCAGSGKDGQETDFTSQNGTAQDGTSQEGTAQDDGKSLEEKLENKIAIEIVMETGEVMEAELYPDLAPKTVENFLKLIDEDFYAGLIFHRIIPGFMIQGGGITKDMQEKPADSIYGEFTNNGFKNELQHTRGVLSMARTMVPDSGSSQFFIMHDTAPWLDGEYAAFGMVTSGLETVDAIASLETDENDFPLNPPVIKTIKRK